MVSCVIQSENTTLLKFQVDKKYIDAELSRFQLIIGIVPARNVTGDLSPGLLESETTDLYLEEQSQLFNCHHDYYDQYKRPPAAQVVEMLNKISLFVGNNDGLSAYYRYMEQYILDSGDVNLKITDPNINCFYSLYDSLIGELDCIKKFLNFNSDSEL